MLYYKIILFLIKLKGKIILNLREELIEKYNITGRVGFTKPKTYDEAMLLIDTICEYNESKEETVVYNLSDITSKLRKFFAEDFN